MSTGSRENMQKQLQFCLRQRVAASSRGRTLKGLFTAGGLKSLRYVVEKVRKAAAGARASTVGDAKVP